MADVRPDNAQHYLYILCAVADYRIGQFLDDIHSVGQQYDFSEIVISIWQNICSAHNDIDNNCILLCCTLAHLENGQSFSVLRSNNGLNEPSI